MHTTGSGLHVDAVFQMPSGDVWSPEYVSNHWRYLVGKHAPRLELPVINLHDLRHTSATIGLTSGETPLESLGLGPR